MLDAPRRQQRLSIALPASLTQDVPHLREKTSKAGMIARALAIFRVEKAVIYNDISAKGSGREGSLLAKLLAYQETPQYLRKILYSHDPDLQFTGVLPPLRLPSHPNLMEPRTGLVREAVVVESGMPSRVNAGFKDDVRVGSKLKSLERVTVRLTKTSPHIEGELLNPSRLPIYWGFRISRTDSKLGTLIKGENPDLTISTSRNGRALPKVADELRIRWKTSRNPMVLFGSPLEGIPEILSREGFPISEITDFNINTVPNQGVETVRTEEAVLATLAGLNLLEDA